MPRARKTLEGSNVDSRQRLVETASKLMRVQGYHATGLNQIVEQSQAPKGSLYHYFPEGKEQLAAEALRHAGMQMGQQLKALANLTPEQAMDQLVEASIRDLEESDYRDCCPIAGVALETHTSCPKLTQLCGQIFDGALQIVEELLARDGRHSAEECKDLALTIFATFEGALMLSAVRKNPAPLKTAVAQIKRWL